MYRTATVAAYDVLDTVHLTCTVTLYDGLGLGQHEVELHTVATVDGVGSSEGSIWLRDALVALIESL